MVCYDDAVVGLLIILLSDWLNLSKYIQCTTADTAIRSSHDTEFLAGIYLLHFILKHVTFDWIGLDWTGLDWIDDNT